MNSARSIKLRMPKPRNPLVPAAATRKAGSHRKSRASERQQQKALLQKQLKEM